MSPAKGPAAATLVPGLVDGLVTTAVDQDGSVSLHLVIGGPGGGCAQFSHIELVLAREDAGRLGQTLQEVRDPRRSAVDPHTVPIACCVGICLGSSVQDR